MSTTVAFTGWNGAQRAWDTSTWNTSPAFSLTATGSVGLISTTRHDKAFVTGITATGSVGLIAQEGDAIVGPTGVAGTSAIGDVFSTNVGFGSTASIGTISTTRGDKAFVTGIAGTSALGSFFTTNTMVTMTASVNSATAETVGTANVEVTGVSGTGLVTAITDFPVVWGQIIPSQTPNFSAISPSQDPSWTDVAA